MTTSDPSQEMVDTHYRAAKLAEESIGAGKPFLGAYGIAEAMGLDRDTLLGRIAVQSAYRVFQSHTIIVDGMGRQVGG